MPTVPVSAAAHISVVVNIQDAKLVSAAFWALDERAGDEVARVNFFNLAVHANLQHARYYIRVLFALRTQFDSSTLPS